MTRALRAVLALVAVLALSACSGEEPPRDGGSGSGDGYGVPQD